MTEILEISVIFSLPEWVGKYDYYQRHYDENGHYQYETVENEVADYLYEEMGWDEASMHPMGRWVKFKVTHEVNYTMKEVLETQHSLHEILEGHFRAGKRKPHGNVY